MQPASRPGPLAPPRRDGLTGTRLEIARADAAPPARAFALVLPHAGSVVRGASYSDVAPPGVALVAAVLAAATEPLEDRVVYLQRADRE